MGKYGLERGIEGSKAKHKSTLEHYRDTFEQTRILKEEVGGLQLQKDEGMQAVNTLRKKEAIEQQRLAALQAEADKKQMEVAEKEKQLRKVKNDVVKVGFEKTAKEAGKGILEGIGALVGSSKAKKLEAQNDVLKQKIEIILDEKEGISKQAKKEIAEKDRVILEKDSLIAVQNSKMDRLFEYFPVLSEYDFIMRLCERMKIPADIVKQVFTGKEAVYTGKLYSPEHKQDFEAENIKVSIAKDTKNNKPSLMLGGMVYADWFRMQKQKFLERIGIKVNENKKQMRLKQ